MTERTWSRRQILSVAPIMENTLPPGIVDKYRLAIAKDRSGGTLWWEDGDGDFRFFEVGGYLADALLALPEETATGAIPDNFVDKGGASPSEYLTLRDEWKALSTGYNKYWLNGNWIIDLDAIQRAIDSLPLPNGGVTDYMLGKSKPAICEEKPEPTGFRWLGTQWESYSWPKPPLSIGPVCPGDKLEFGVFDLWRKPPNQQAEPYRIIEEKRGRSMLADPFSKWPSCHKCSEKAGKYVGVQWYDVASTDILTMKAKVRADCHGEKWTHTVDVYEAWRGDEPYALFAPGYDK